MDDVITLITETMTTDETGFPIATETEYETFCQVDTVTRAEFFDAGKAGMTPEYMFTVNAVEYSGQTKCKYDGKTYTIYRVFHRKSDDMMELYAEYRSGVTDGPVPTLEPTPEPTLPSEETDVIND